MDKRFRPVNDERTSDQLAVIAQISARLALDEIRHWLIGGWATDHHAGRITRTHSDVDFAAFLGDRERIAMILDDAGFFITGPTSAAGESFDDGAVTIELTYLVEGTNGEVFTPGFESWPWPAETFGRDSGALTGVPVPLASVAGLLATKRGWEDYLDEPLRDHDRADIEVLESIVNEVLSRAGQSAVSRQASCADLS